MEQENGGAPSCAGRTSPAPATNHFSKGFNSDCCTGTLQHCNYRWDDGRCLLRLRPCRWLPKFPISDCRFPIELKERTSEILQEIHQQRDLLIGLINGQEKLSTIHRDIGSLRESVEKTSQHPPCGNSLTRPSSTLSYPMGEGNVPAAEKEIPAANQVLRAIGRFQYRPGFKDVWLGGEHYDLRGRAKARFCIQFLEAKQAFNEGSARHLETEIDPFIRKKCHLPPLPESAQSNLRIQHYFNDPSRKLSQLRRDLIKAAGRNGRFYLQVL